MTDREHAGLAQAIERLSGDLGVAIPEALDESPSVAQALWLLLRSLPPERETCPACDGRRFKVETARTRDTFRAREWARSRRNRGWHVIEGPGDIGNEIVQQYSLPCKACRPPLVRCESCAGVGVQHQAGGCWRPGAESMSRHRSCPDCLGCGSHLGQPRGYATESWPWADHFLGAMPLTAEQRSAAYIAALDSDDDRVTGTEHDRAQPGHHDALTVFADELQTAGDPLGEWLALWLTRAPCASCDGNADHARFWVTDDFGDDVLATGTCPSCCGTGLALVAHEDAIAAACRRAARERSTPPPRLPHPDSMHGAAHGFGGEDAY